MNNLLLLQVISIQHKMEVLTEAAHALLVGIFSKPFSNAGSTCSEFIKWITLSLNYFFLINKHCKQCHSLRTQIFDSPSKAVVNWSVNVKRRVKCRLKRRIIRHKTLYQHSIPPKLGRGLYLAVDYKRLLTWTSNTKFFDA